MQIPFRKFQGLGNDFMLFDGLTTATLPKRVFDTTQVTRSCDRHLGVGADGCLYVLPPTVEGARARMIVINADGSRPQMCGNGLRCVAKFLDDAYNLHGEKMVVETDAGMLSCSVDHGRSRPLDRLSLVHVAMGAATFDRQALPMVGAGDFVEQSIEIGVVRLIATAVSVGNPHLVTFVDEAPHVLATSLGPAAEHHHHFPERVNFEVAQVLSATHITLAVWERGCGLTRACGTGACAAAAAAVKTERCSADVPLAVDLPGGTLEITVAADFKEIEMAGPAAEVFSGVLPL